MRCLLPALLTACAAASDRPPAHDTAPAEWDRGENPHQQDDLLRLNHVQTKGSHNSYHQRPESLFDASHDYSHPTLTDQLDLHHVRQLELDVHLTDDGVWHVFHLPVLDEETSCLVFVDCLQELKDWSDDHGWHLPVVVWIEPKDELDEAAVGYQRYEGLLTTLDDDIRSVWPEDRLFTPDDLRGSHATLPEALAADGWPLLADVRGQLLLSVLSTGAERAEYLEGSEVLEGRAMFVDSDDASEPYAATIKDIGGEALADALDRGFLTTRNGAGAGDDLTAAGDSDAAKLAEGVHHLATDFVGPDDGGYWLDLAPRCNPVTAPPECQDSEVERLDD